MELDGKLIKKEGHDYLKEALNFPDYYGKNLDALYDCLCEIGIETQIDTFVDASAENELLDFKCD